MKGIVHTKEADRWIYLPNCWVCFLALYPPGFRGINTISINFQPCSYSSEPLYKHDRYHSIRGGANVQKVVTSQSHCCNQILQHKWGNCCLDVYSTDHYNMISSVQSRNLQNQWILEPKLVLFFLKASVLCTHLDDGGQIHQFRRPHIPSVTPGYNVHRLALLPFVFGQLAWSIFILTVVVAAMFTRTACSPSVIGHYCVLGWRYFIEN